MTKTTKEISNMDDVIDVRDVVARVEALENMGEDDDIFEEFTLLTRLLEDLKGNGGNVQWRGYWYPLALIRESYFENYAEVLAEDMGAINNEATWPNNCIDWERAARELMMDYTSVEFDGVTYYYTD